MTVIGYIILYPITVILSSFITKVVIGMTDPLYLVLVKDFIGLIFTLLIVYFYNRHAFKIAVGLKARLLNIFHGFLIGSLLVVLGFGMLVLFDQIKINQVVPPEFDIFFGFIILCLAAFEEELFFRVLLINHLDHQFDKLFSILISSTVFLLFHLPGLTDNYIGMVNVFCGGVLLGSCYLISKNIWLPWAFHLGWNFSQGIMFGINLSEYLFEPIFGLQLVGPPFLTGGKFGYEASVVSCVLVVMTAVVCIYKVRRKSQDLPTLKT